jgi:hypothetical protein
LDEVTKGRGGSQLLEFYDIGSEIHERPNPYTEMYREKNDQPVSYGIDLPAKPNSRKEGDLMKTMNDNPKPFEINAMWSAY